MRFRVRDKDEKGWVHETLQSESTIPAKGLRRLEVLKKAGIPIKELVIAHEAPKLLTAAREEKPTVDLSFNASPALEALGEVLAAVIAVFGLILITAIRLDPALIVVLEDGTFLEVMTWYD